MTNPSVTDFKNYFTRDFPYGATSDTVMDSDIARAINDTALTIHPGLAGSQADYTMQFLYLSAHNLVMNLRASSQGISGQYAWLQTSRGVGSVSEGTAIPQRILDNPQLAMLAKTNYGAKYLSIIMPRILGQMFIAQGTTQA